MTELPNIKKRIKFDLRNKNRMSLGISHSSENNNFSFIKSIYLPFGAKNKKTTMSTKPKSINFVAIILVQTIFFFCFHYPAMIFSQVETLFHMMIFLLLLVPVVPQSYSVNVMDEHVLRGNTGILKCHIPSFVADFVSVSAWIENDQTEIYAEPSNFGNAQIGTHNPTIHSNH